jgi:hypothetical protein
VTESQYRQDVAALMTEPRQVTAVMRFRGGPGREDDAARAWAFELTYYFTRGTGEPPQVTWADGVYTVTGLMQTTHPYDQPVTLFNRDEPGSLDFTLEPGRSELLRGLYSRRGIWFDGRDH